MTAQDRTAASKRPRILFMPEHDPNTGWRQQFDELAEGKRSKGGSLS